MLQGTCQGQPLLAIELVDGRGDVMKRIGSEKCAPGLCQFNLPGASPCPSFEIAHIAFRHEGAHRAGDGTNSNTLKSGKGARCPLRRFGGGEVAQCCPLGREQIRCKSKGVESSGGLIEEACQSRRLNLGSR